MGNEVSSLDIEDDQDGPIREENPGFSTEIKNGPITLQSSPGVEVGSKQPVQQEKVITSSQKTIVISPISNGGVTNLQTNPPPQAAKSKFSLAILHPSPGHTAFQPNGLDVGAVKPQVTLIQSQKGKENINGVQNPASPSALMTEEVYLSQAKPTEVESAPEKPKEVSIFHRLFKPDKKVEFEAPLQLEASENQAVKITVDQNKVLQSTPQSSNTQPQNIDDNKRVAVQEQSSESASVSASPETISAALQTTPPPEINPVMSFFKTLVTPNKSVPKSEEEVKGEADDKKKENGGLRKSSSKKEKTKSAVQQTAETENKGLKKSDSPKSKTLSRLFRQKSKKEEQQTSGSNVVLEQPVVSVTSQRPAPEQILTQDPKSSDVPSQITASEDEKKAVKEPAPRPKPFWRKSFKGDPQPSKIQENVVVEQPVVSLSLNTAKSAPEQVVIQDTKPSDSEIPPQDNGKPAEEVVTRSVPFWKKSFKGEPQPRKPQENVVVEQPVVSLSLNSEKSVPEQVVIQDTKPSDSDIPAQDNGKPAQEVSSWPVPFWRKSSKGEPQPIKIQENSLPEEPQPVQLTLTASAEPGPQTNKGDSGDKTAAAGSKSQESLGKKTEDGKNSKPKLMMFFKQLSVIGDGSNPSADEKSTNSPTLDITDGAEVGKSEKTVVTAVIEPPPQKGKENLKEKKASAEKLTKQESRESQEAAGSAQFQTPDAVLVQNGGESSKEGQLKKIEKRQSLGSFFKAIGPKRMCDAEVQTDPVSILPAEKAK